MPTNSGPFSIVPFTGYMTEALGSAAATDVVKVTASDSSVTGSASVAGVLLAGNNITISGGGSLDLGISGQTGTIAPLLATGTTTTGDVINVPTQMGSNQGVVVNDGSQPLTFAGVLGGSAGLTLGGTGPITLSGANSYSGTTTLTSGTLILNSNGIAGTASGPDRRTRQHQYFSNHRRRDPGGPQWRRQRHHRRQSGSTQRQPQPPAAMQP